MSCGGNLAYHLASRPKWFNEGVPKELKFNGGVSFTLVDQNGMLLKKICPGIYYALSIKQQGICMIGSK